MEHDGVVDAVEELRTEVRLECVVDLFLHALVRNGFVGLTKTNVGFAEIGGTEV